MTFVVRYLLALTILFGSLIGCADSGNSKPTTQPASVRDRQNAALSDPFGYGGTEKGLPDQDRYDVTGGGPRELDKKALKRDLNSVFNP